MNLTKEQLAEMLNGRQYRNELTEDEFQLAKDNDLVVVFGASDDLIEFRGAIYDEFGGWGGGVFTFTKDGKFPPEDDLEALNKYVPNFALNTIESVWCDKELYCSWSYRTEIPHATFKIYEVDELYCFGIVFSVNDLK